MTGAYGVVPIAAGLAAAFRVALGRDTLVALAVSAVASRDEAYGAGYGSIWGTPFAFAASRRLGIAKTVTAAVSLAAALAIQAGHVDDPRAFAPPSRRG
ncbi:hypothetical protein [Baekduia alba]|uniref:hypothetical protein n=1 Tax=Baekduia alba TaxID=2997333 RepID=UPI0023414E4D|nr:hypothetical protein [Baekduia alba]